MFFFGKLFSGLVGNLSVLAQNTPAPVVVEQTGGNSAMEWGIVAVVCGLAIFAVCRTIHRA